MELPLSLLVGLRVSAALPDCVAAADVDAEPLHVALGETEAVLVGVLVVDGELDAGTAGYCPRSVMKLSVTAVELRHPSCTRKAPTATLPPRSSPPSIQDPMYMEVPGTMARVRPLVEEETAPSTYTVSIPPAPAPLYVTTTWCHPPTVRE